MPCLRSGRALPPCLAPNFFSSEKFFDQKFSAKLFLAENFSAEKFLVEKIFGRKQIGGKVRVTEIPEGGFAPPDPPTTKFQKICPPGKFFEMIFKKEDFGDGRRRNVRPKKNSPSVSLKAEAMGEAEASFLGGIFSETSLAEGLLKRISEKRKLIRWALVGAKNLC